MFRLSYVVCKQARIAKQVGRVRRPPPALRGPLVSSDSFLR